MKKVDKVVFKAFFGPFILTMLVVVFILLTQHMLKYFDDLVGKDLGMDVLGQLIFYFAVFVTPFAFPLGVLLSSLMSFGNLGEHSELTAIKSGGISLLRIMRSIFIFVLFLTVFAFISNNYFVPKAALEAYSLMWDIKRKKPTLDLPEGEFYSGIENYRIRVGEKIKIPGDEEALMDLIIYDHSDRAGNKEVTIADSGRMTTIMNDRYLQLELFKGHSYMEGASNNNGVNRKSTNLRESFSKVKFDQSSLIFDLASFDLDRTEKELFSSHRLTRNIHQINVDIDSMNLKARNRKYELFISRSRLFDRFFTHDDLEEPPYVTEHRLYLDEKLQAEIAAEKREMEKEAQAEDLDSTEQHTKNPQSTVEEDPIQTQEIDTESALPTTDSITSIVEDTSKKDIPPTRSTLEVKKEEDKPLNPLARRLKGRSPEGSSPPSGSSFLPTQPNNRTSTQDLQQSNAPLATPSTDSEKEKEDSTTENRPSQIKSVLKSTAENPREEIEEEDPKELLADKENLDSLYHTITTDSARSIIDSLESFTKGYTESGFDTKVMYERMLQRVRMAKNRVATDTRYIDSIEQEKRVFKIQYHKIIANAVACIIMFMIGAPLGAIIKKGGLGVPVLISIFFFIIYYVLMIMGEKWAKSGVMEPWMGIWQANLILMPLGVLFLLQARRDARIFESDFYLVIISKFMKWMNRKKESDGMIKPQ